MHLRRPPRGKKYRENRETSPKDTRGSTEFSQSDTPGGSLTKVSTDKRTVGTPDDKSGGDSNSSSGPGSSESDQSPGRDSPDRSVWPRSKDRRSEHRSPDRTTRNQTSGRSKSRHRSPDRSISGHRVGPHPGRTVVRLDKGHRDGHHSAILGTGQFGTGLREGHPVLDLITDLIQGIVIRSVEGIDQEWRDTLDPDAINVITVQVQVLIRTRGLDQSAWTGLPRLIDTGIIRRRRLTNVALLLSLETT